MGLVASVCLYGNSKTGFAYLASVPGVTGKGESLLEGGWLPEPGVPLDKKKTRPGVYSGLTMAVFAACREVTSKGVDGKARVFAPGGRRYADVELRHPGWAGSLNWKAC